MANTLGNHKKTYWIICIAVIGFIASCTKNNSGSAPSISRVRTVYRSVTDTITTYTITYVDSSGTVVADTVKNTGPKTTVIDFDSTTTSGNLQSMYAIIGKNLSSATEVTFNGYSAYFNPALISDTSILVTIPKNTPAGPNQSNTLSVVTLHGTANFAFSVPFPPPTIVTTTDYNFTAGTNLTFTGIGFASVTAVGLTGVTDVATIVSQSDSVLTIQMPATTATRANLVFTYGSGTVVSTQEFVDMDNAYQIFTDDFQNLWGDNSWSGPSGRSTAAAKTGVASYLFTYPAGGWKIEGAANWYPSIDYDPAYKYLSFWIKGGTVAHTLVLVGDQMNGGYSQNTSSSAFLVPVPAGVWTYYKIPLAPPSSTNPKLLNFWANGTPAKQLGFFLQGQNGDVDETMYVDDLIFVK